MNLDTSIGGLGSQIQGLTESARSTLTDRTTALKDRGAERLRAGLAHLLGAVRTRAPIVHDGFMELLEWTRQARNRLRGIDYGARTVQTVGAAVVLGTLYVAIWGVGPRPVTEAPEIVAARIAPIGTLSLQETNSPMVAEQPSATADSAASL